MPHTFSLLFLIADDKTSIIVQLVCLYFNISVNMRQQSLIDNATKVSLAGMILNDESTTYIRSAAPRDEVARVFIFVCLDVDDVFVASRSPGE